MRRPDAWSVVSLVLAAVAVPLLLTYQDYACSSLMPSSFACSMAPVRHVACVSASVWDSSRWWSR